MSNGDTETDARTVQGAIKSRVRNGSWNRENLNEELVMRCKQLIDSLEDDDD